MKRITAGIAFLLVIGGAALLSSTFAEHTVAATAQAMQCGATGNTVAAQFKIPAASRIFDYFPHMGISPELSEDDGPAYVVVFSGDYVTPKSALAPNLAPKAAQQDVICVIQGDGTINVYADVSRVGYSAP